jgi:hypothetical protein
MELNIGGGAYRSTGEVLWSTNNDTGEALIMNLVYSHGNQQGHSVLACTETR